MPFILWNCSDDKDGNEDEPTTNQNPIAGKWLEQGDPSCGVIFKNDGTFTTFGSDVSTGTYKVSGNDIVINEFDPRYNEWDLWAYTILQISRDVLIVNEDGEVKTYSRDTSYSDDTKAVETPKNDYKNLIIGKWNEQGSSTWLSFDKNESFSYYSSGTSTGKYNVVDDVIVLKEYDSDTNQYQVNWVWSIVSLNKNTLVIDFGYDDHRTFTRE